MKNNKVVEKLINITNIGHSTFLIEYGEFNILTDPFFSSSFSGLKRKILPAISVEKLPRIDLILISHTHLDHCDYDALNKIDKSSIVIMPKKTSSKVRKMGFNIVELDCWESNNIQQHKITAVPAKHQGKCVGFIIEGSKTIYFAGDTFFIPSMTEIGNKYKLDVAFLPIGGNRFFGFKMVMDPKDAALATEEVKSKIVIPIHFGTFGKIPMMFSMNGTTHNFLKYVGNNKIQTSIKIPNIGETYGLV
ncbi:MAG: MBL fold metallo-hydrolase [ANME-2 cluster archaeon]|nr:MBL fold metallo-hydrolase [ANME-2 cluster archaeon]MBC2706677.1 MBL fold metallo-hydrolase [ANME-2 cluster archaeon]MBC2748707.1 MBL fold metallo-hydrolase [ANME-2 cluster archaeon]MBC2764334.1 MBL fold metallo-hydrolase [ANME-2 cluster archaeon]